MPDCYIGTMPDTQLFTPHFPKSPTTVTSGTTTSKRLAANRSRRHGFSDRDRHSDHTTLADHAAHAGSHWLNRVRLTSARS